ncbi:large ribosomal subunit protein eL42-like [Delphinus delphis]|uniref:large ribosomal subunit protein eL42-like n=1 Tax=Delphinus delphis TaxID=9728 RepID=UPI0028C472FD|nr:large ribosomal subunit protein eL42-like [Delphinus delphis]
MVNVPKTRQTFCKKYGRHQSLRTGRARTLCAQGKQHYNKKQSGYGGQTKRIFQKKPKITKKIVLRFECIEPNCRSRRTLALKRCKHPELGKDKKRKDQVIQFSASYPVSFQRQ